MDTVVAFQILECEQTKDKAVITNAYRKKLVTVNPEEDPKGFMELRTAFEAAVKYSEEVENEEGIKIPETPMELFIHKVKNLYYSKEKRIDPKAWEEVLEDEVCVYLETADEALRQLLIFFMDHFRLTHPVWKAIDQKVGMTTRSNDFYEDFPEEFVRFIKGTPYEPNFFPFELIEGENFEQIDEFVRYYYDCKHFFDLRQLEDVKEAIKQMEQTGLDHPYVHIERMGLANLEENKDIVREELKYLEAYEPKNEFISFHIAYYYSAMDEIEQAVPILEKLLEENPKHYSARKLYYEYLYKTEQYKEARKGYLDLLDYENHDPDLVEKLQKCNEIVIPILEKEFEETHDYDLYIESCWALFQNDRQEEALKKLEDYPEEERKPLNYDNICGKMYASLRRYEEAIPYLKRWREALKQVEDDGTEKNAKEIKKIPYSTLMIVNCYMEIGKQSKNPDEYFEKAMAEMPKDLKEDDEHFINYMTMRAYIKLTLKDYEACIDCCDKVLNIEPHNIYAHIYIQEAFYEIRNGQNVVNEYHYLKEYAPGYEKSYEFAARVFFAYNQHEDVFSVVEEAKKREVDSLLLEFLYTRSKRYVAEEEPQMRELEDKYKDIIHKMETEETSIEDRLEVYREQIYLYMDLKEFNTALKLCEKILQNNSEEKEKNLFLKADILRQDERYQDAIKIFVELDKNEEEYEGYAFNAACCYHELRQWEKEKMYLKRTLSLNPMHRSANGRMADLLKRQLKEKWDWKLYKNAVSYASKQIEVLPNCYYLIERGLLYLDAGLTELAKEDFQAAIEDDPEDLFAYNNMGFAYEQEWNFEKAIEYYLKSIELVKNKETGLPFINVADCYKALGNYEKAMEYYQKRVDMFPENAAYAIRKMAECAYRLKHFDDALNYYKELEPLVKNEDDIQEDTLTQGDIYLDMGNEEKAISYYQKYASKSKSLLRKKSVVTIDGLRRMTYYWGYHKNDWNKAKSYISKAWSMVKLEDGNDYISVLIVCMMCNYYLGEMEENKEFYKKAQIFFEGFSESGENEYVKNPNHQPVRYRRAFDVEYYSGNIEKAREYLKKMKESPRCSNCDFRKCEEAMEKEVMLLLAELKEKKDDKKKEKAYALIEELLEVYPTCGEALVYRKLLNEL